MDDGIFWHANAETCSKLAQRVSGVERKVVYPVYAWTGKLNSPSVLVRAVQREGRNWWVLCRINYTSPPQLCTSLQGWLTDSLSTDNQASSRHPITGNVGRMRETNVLGMSGLLIHPPTLICQSHIWFGCRTTDFWLLFNLLWKVPL